MRVKISFAHPIQRTPQNVLLSIPGHLKYIVDLEVFLIDKLKLGKHLEQSKTEIVLRINGYSLPKSEKIKGLISDDDLITLEYIEGKRKAEKNIQNDVEDILNSDYSKNGESKDHNFLKMIEEVTLLRRIYHKMKNNVSTSDFDIQHVSAPVLKKKESIRKEVSSDSESEEVRIPKHKVKLIPQPQQTKKNKVIEYISSESSEEEVPIVKKKDRTKIHEEKPKPKDKKISKKLVEEDDDEEKNEPEIVEKKIDTSKIGLKILKPEEEFLIKQEHWKSLPVYEWTSKLKKDKKDQQPKMKKNKNYNQTIENKKEQIVDPKFAASVRAPNQKFEIKNKIEVNKKFVEAENNIKAPKNYTVVPIKMVTDLWKNQSKLFFKLNDIIKYKCEILTSLNEPGMSEFRYGVIVKTDKNQFDIDRSNYMRVNEEEESEIETTDHLFLHNIHDVSICEESLDEERKKLIQNFMDNAMKFVNEQKELLEKKKQLQEKLKSLAEKPNEESTEELNPEKLKRQMIGKQISYYFSDRNYFKDDFIQTHCSKHPDNYMEVKLLLNFPKIRQMTTELPMILESIDTVQSLSGYECSFEVNPEKTLIRKKIPQKDHESKGL